MSVFWLLSTCILALALYFRDSGQISLSMRVVVSLGGNTAFYTVGGVLAKNRRDDFVFI